MRIPKRVNARLQLAAALIEADNEVIKERLALEEERARYHQKAGLAAQEQGKFPPESYIPASLPPLRLASESAIFAPYRDEDEPLPHQRSRASSLASRLSLLEAAHQQQENPDDEGSRRPSVDFLGVALPSEKERRKSRSVHSRTTSLASLSRTSFDSAQAYSVAHSQPGTSINEPGHGDTRPQNLDSLAVGYRAEEDEEQLEAWNIDKFLSSEEKRKIEGRRSRANSVVGLATVEKSGRRDSIGSAGGISFHAGSDLGTHQRTQSETMTQATGLDDLAQLRRRTRSTNKKAAPDPVLLARIRLYRERHENLPPSEWNGPGPLADEEAVKTHLDQSAATGTSPLPSVKQIATHSHSLSEADNIELARRKSSVGSLGRRWSEELDNSIRQSIQEEGDAPSPNATPGPQRTFQQEQQHISEIAQAPEAPRRINDSARRMSSGLLIARAPTPLGADLDPFGSYHMEGTTRYPDTVVNAALPETGQILRPEWEQHLHAEEDEDDLPLGLRMPVQRNVRQSLPMDGLTTKQLQRLARHGTLPEFYGELPSDVRSSIDTSRQQVDDEVAFMLDSIKPKPLKPSKSAFEVKLPKQQAKAQSKAADLTSSKWRSRSQIARLSSFFEASKLMSEERGTDEKNTKREEPQNEDLEAWRESGPLQARGLHSRMPKTLVMPEPLKNSPLAPSTTPLSSLASEGNEKTPENVGPHVPPGFVLHDGKGLPPVRFIPVQAAATASVATGEKTKDKKANVLMNDFLQSTLAERPVPVPITAPEGIGRRAANTTTALFRNQLVQNAEEREGWGWEGTSVPPPAADADAKTEKLARQKAGRGRGKKGSSRMAKHKSRAGKSGGFTEVATEEGADSNDEAASDGSDETSASSDEFEDVPEQWIDDRKPAGRLYGRSLLDIADERATTRKTAKR